MAKKTREELIDLLAKALPFVEDTETDWAFKKGVVKEISKQIREAIEQEDK